MSRKKHPLYSTWCNMRVRCNNKDSKDYTYYGGKGVKVDPSWDCFYKFVEDMGERPSGMTLDRIDGNGNYCKDNCRWATRLQQSNNRNEYKHELTWLEITRRIERWSQLLEVPKTLFHKRLKRGWSAEKTLTTPVRKIIKQKPITYLGITRPLARWAKIFDLPHATLLSRLNRGWSVDKAFSTSLIDQEYGLSFGWKRIGIIK